MSTASERRPLLIAGAGSFAEEVAELAAETDTYEPIAFIEGVDRSRCERSLNGLPVWWIDDLPRVAAGVEAVCAVGSPRRAAFIQQVEARGVRFTSIVHPSAHRAASSTLGIGSIVGVGSIVAARVAIGAHVIVNRGCLIGHHTHIGNCTTLSPGVNVAGRVRIGDGCYIGMGAIVLDGLTLGSGSVVGAGAVVTRDVQAHVQVVGMPARAVKELPSL